MKEMTRWNHGTYKGLFGFLFHHLSLLTQFSSLITHHSSLPTCHLKYPNFLTQHVWHIFLVLITQLFLLFCGTHTLTQRRLFFSFSLDSYIFLCLFFLIFPFIFLWNSCRKGLWGREEVGFGGVLEKQWWWGRGWQPWRMRDSAMESDPWWNPFLIFLTSTLLFCICT